MTAHELATQLITNLTPLGLTGRLGMPIQYGQQVFIYETATPNTRYLANVYLGKKGPSLVFQGTWSETVKETVQSVWVGNAVTPRIPSTAVVTQAVTPPSSPAQVVLYVDGSYQENELHQAIGWAFEAWIDGKPSEHQQGCLPDESLLGLRNVAGECTAVLKALAWAHAHHYTHVDLRYDYTGIAAWPTGQWNAHTAFTRHYVHEVTKTYSTILITFTKIAAHSGDPGNERVDRFAREASRVSH